jgi:hypothetical protein
MVLSTLTRVAGLTTACVMGSSRVPIAQRYCTISLTGSKNASPYYGVRKEKEAANENNSSQKNTNNMF